MNDGGVGPEGPLSLDGDPEGDLPDHTDGPVDFHAQEETAGLFLGAEDVELHLTFDIGDGSDECLETIITEIDPPRGLRQGQVTCSR